MGLARAPEVLEAVEHERISFTVGFEVAWAAPEMQATLTSEVESGQLRHEAVPVRVRELRAKPSSTAAQRSLRQALRLLETITLVQSPAEVELVEQAFRHAQRLHRLAPRGDVG